MRCKEGRSAKPPADPYGRFLTPAEVADRLRVSTTTVMRWIHDGRLPAIRVSERVYRVPIGAYDRFISGAPPPRPTIVHREVDEWPPFGEDEELPTPRQMQDDPST